MNAKPDHAPGETRAAVRLGRGLADWISGGLPLVLALAVGGVFDGFLWPFDPEDRTAFGTIALLVTELVFGYLLSESDLAGTVRRKLGRDPAQQAFHQKNAWSTHASVSSK